MKKLTQALRYKIWNKDLRVDGIRLGPWTSHSLLNDPVHITFVLSRYKFVARMLTGKSLVLEVGCGDAPGTPIVAEFVKKVIAVDIDENIIAEDRERLKRVKNIEFRHLDICKQTLNKSFDAAYSIDVIEHLEKTQNNVFMENICKCLVPDGVCIIGTPNEPANKYATPQSRHQHINLHVHSSLRILMSRYFKNIFMFAMNDEVVHTGFPPMAHYLFGMGVGVK